MTRSSLDYDGDTDAFHRMLGKSAAGLAVISVVGFWVFLAVGDQALHLWLGIDFSEKNLFLMSMLLMTTLYASLSFVFGNLSVTSKRVKPPALTGLLIAVLAVITLIVMEETGVRTLEHYAYSVAGFQFVVESYSARMSRGLSFVVRVTPVSYTHLTLPTICSV